MQSRSFPVKTALALTSAVLLLAVYRRFDKTKGLSPAIFADAARLNLLRHPSAQTAANTTAKSPIADAKTPQNGPQKTQTESAAVREPISPYLIDDSGALDPFFAALHQLELPPTPGQPQIVTILHYGDSPTTADLITGDVRQSLQARFGDAGDGVLLAAKPWAWYQHRGVEIDDHGWTISTAVGKGREEVYGIGGASFEGAPGAASRIVLRSAPQATVEIAFLARPKGGSFTVAANGADLATIATDAEAPHPTFHSIVLPPVTKTVEIKAASGSVRLFGETFRTGRRGILYDSLGLNGASTSVLSNGFNAAAWTAALQHEAPQLVVVNYGTNESSFGPYVAKYYEATLRAAIVRIRAALPGVAIVVMSPMDRGQRTGVDQIQTYDTIPRIVAIQRRVAAELGCGFFDTFDAMGGDGTMARWYTGHPRLVAGDLIHPTPQGAAIVAQLFVKDLYLGFDRYLRRQQPGYRPPPQTTPPQPEPSKIQETPAVVPAAKPQAPEPEPEPAASPAEPPKATPHDEPPPAATPPPPSL